VPAHPADRSTKVGMTYKNHNARRIAFAMSETPRSSLTAKSISTIDSRFDISGRSKQQSQHSQLRAYAIAETFEEARFVLYLRRLGISLVVSLALVVLYHRYASIFNMCAAKSYTEPCVTEACITSSSDHADTIFLPYVYPFTTSSIPLVNTTISGVKIEMPVDTGSTGILVGAPLLSDLDPTAGTPAYYFFTSSKILYNGRLVTLTVTFHGSSGSYAQARVPVFVVDKSWECEWYNTTKDTFACPLGPKGEEPKSRDTSKITYMGVGFGRNIPGSGKPGAVPAANPFLNIVSFNGQHVPPDSMRAGWVISTKGVHIGLTPSNTRGFNFTQLSPGVTYANDPRDWSMIQTQLSVDGKEGGVGYGLVDTGVAQMYLRALEDSDIPIVQIPDPNGEKDKLVDRVKPGTLITIGFPSLGSKQVAGRDLVVGEGAGGKAPSFIAPGKQTPPPFVNTGRTFLYTHSIAFDAVSGRFGFGSAPFSPTAQL
jgi:hypothetical protein